MKRIRTFVVLLAIAVTAPPAFAVDSGTSHAIRQHAPKGITETFYRCTDKTEGDIIGAAACVTAEKKVQDARLNKAYASLMKSLKGNAKESLKIAERSWLDFNDKSVNAELDMFADATTVNLEAATNEVLRYCERANTLEGFAFLAGD